MDEESDTQGKAAYKAFPCPVCHLVGGFHDADLTLAEGGLHAAARERVDPRLIKPPSSISRAEQSHARHLANEAWKAGHCVSA